MPMTMFVNRFPGIGPRETKTLVVVNHQGIPDGEYGFFEFYCDEAGCDCRRVIISVLCRETGTKIWATIGYGWESLAYYRQRCPAVDTNTAKGPALDPLNPQSEYAPVLLELFRGMLQSPDYVERLKRHYAMFRESTAQYAMLEANRAANRRKRLRDPRRRK